MTGLTRSEQIMELSSTVKCKLAPSNIHGIGVFAIRDIKKGEKFTKENIWVKRPGTGEIKAIHFTKVLGKKASKNIPVDTQIKLSDLV